MEIEFDPAKRALTLKDRGLDFVDAPRLFANRSLTVVDDRMDYGEERFVSYGFIDAVAVALVWTDCVDRPQRGHADYLDAKDACRGDTICRTGLIPMTPQS